MTAEVKVKYKHAHAHTHTHKTHTISSHLPTHMHMPNPPQTKTAGHFKTAIARIKVAKGQNTEIQ